jgi:hypothetical protein
MFVDEHLVGSKTDIRKIILSEQLVKDYLVSLGDQSHNKIKIVPSTLPFIFWQYFSVPWLEGKGPLIHGNQQFEYSQSLQINETYECHITFNKAYTKRNLQFLEHELIIKQDGREIGTASSTFIIIGKKGGIS